MAGPRPPANLSLFRYSLAATSNPSPNQNHNPNPNPPPRQLPIRAPRQAVRSVSRSVEDVRPSTPPLIEHGPQAPAALPFWPAGPSSLFPPLICTLTAPSSSPSCLFYHSPFSSPPPYLPATSLIPSIRALAPSYVAYGSICASQTELGSPRHTPYHHDVPDHGLEVIHGGEDMELLPKELLDTAVLNQLRKTNAEFGTQVCNPSKDVSSVVAQFAQGGGAEAPLSVHPICDTDRRKKWSELLKASPMAEMSV